MSWPIEPPGIWLSIARERAPNPVPALFLDRDGVVVEDVAYLRRTEHVRLVPGIAELIAAANSADVPVLVATNQSGIDRGLFGWAEFAAVDAEITRLLANRGARIDAAAACPFHPGFTAGYGAEHAAWRKPAPGMIDALARRLNVDKARSWLIGDQARDIAAARRAGLAGALRLGKGGPRERTAAGAHPKCGRGFAKYVSTPDDARRFLSSRLLQ